MHQPGPMDRRNRIQHISRYQPHLRRIHRPDGQPIIQRPTIAKRHGEPRQPVRLAAVVHLHDIRVTHPRQRQRLARKPTPKHLLSCQPARQLLERNLTPQHPIMGAEYHPHPTAPELPHQFVSTSNHTHPHTSLTPGTLSVPIESSPEAPEISGRIRVPPARSTAERVLVE